MRNIVGTDSRELGFMERELGRNSREILTERALLRPGRGTPPAGALNFTPKTEQNTKAGDLQETVASERRALHNREEDYVGEQWGLGGSTLG
jgi:hypothetical protein